MASRRIKLISAAAIALVGAGGYLVYSVFAAQAHPDKALAQAPMNTQVQVPAAFIMAVDDSGSMTFQNQFPGADGYGCWSTSNDSFFTSPGVLRTSGGTSCRYAYSYTGPRIGTTYYGIPPVDNYGFARSPDFNPAYFDPNIQYDPWLNSDGTPYGSSLSNPAGNADITATRIDPRDDATIVLTENLFEEAGRSRFHAHDDMYLPPGTRYRLTGGNNCGGLSSGGSGGNRWRVIGSSGHTMSNDCGIYIEYYPATFFVRETTPNTAPTIAKPGYSGITPVRVVDACGTGCHLWKYEIGPDDTVALQNFANWFSYYGNRNRAMIAGMTRSMASVNNMRVGYFRINGTYNNVTMHDMSLAPDRSALYASMIALPASGGTPNLSAVNHLGAQFQREDSGAPVKLSCQRNAGMLFTDGFSNESSTAPAITGLGAPFDPTPANSMAAIASQYYFNTNNTVGGDGVSPLRDDLAAGRVPVPAACSGPDSVERRRLNCQSNLHMNFYGVTLGARGVTFDPDVDQDPFVLNPAWPGYQANNRSTIDDIWHATVNTRGEFINARTPVDIVYAMRRILASVSSGASPSGGIAISGARVASGSIVVTPSYEVTDDSDGTDWYGELEAEQVNFDPATGTVTLGPGGWRASERLPAPADRRIYFGRGNSAVAFEPGNLNLEDLCVKPTGTPVGMSLCEPISTGDPTLIEQMGFNIQDAVAYLRGDATHEGTGEGFLRRRATSKIGDIVNSTPIVSAPTDDYGYRTLGQPGSIHYGNTYTDYLEAKDGRNHMVYVGANDGMLHAFNGEIGPGGGREVFAYIPETALGHMGNLLIPNDPTNQNDQKFQHRYYVDGPITVSDAHLGAGEGWRTVLVGTSGAGGRSVFGLDVSNPSSFGDSSRLWEINDTHSDEDVRKNIGFVLGRPVIVPVRTSATAVRWVAIFGNGYKSENGNAVLFVVDIADGNVQMISAVEAAGAGVPTGDNGLGNIVVVDRWGGDDLNLHMRDGYADTVYAGDQRGAVWKFDLRSETPSAPTMPLFVTQSHTEGARTFRQPILGGIAATVGPSGGVMLYFGTGSFSFEDDPEDDSLQSLYAVNDVTWGEIENTLDVDDLTNVPLNADRTIAPGQTVPLIGWYVNLPEGERMVGYPNVAGGTVFMPTYVPNMATSGCEGGGGNWLFGLNARTGGAGLSNVFSSPGDADPAHDEGTASVELLTGGTAPVKDVGVLTLPRSTAGVPDPTNPIPPGAPERSCWMSVVVAGADPMYLPYPCGRQSWRQIQ